MTDVWQFTTASPFATSNALGRFTDRARKVTELALREALQLGHNYVGTEHILLALIREGEGVAATVLVNRLGLELNKVRQAVVEELTESVARAAAKQQRLKRIDELQAELDKLRGDES